MGLFRSWGFGAELFFEGGKAVAGMSRAQKSVVALKQAFTGLQDAGSRITGGLTSLATLLAPVGIGMGLMAGKASQLAGDLEAQQLTMRVLIGDLEKTDRLLGMISEHALAAPFTEGELIEGSKRLLRLTGDNVDKNFELLQTMETMAALNPGKTLTDAVEGLLDATSGGGFERLKEFGLSFRAEDFKAAGRPGGEAWAAAVVKAMQDKMQELTRGQDLVGMLATTMGGRLSTLQDSIENVLKRVGKRINATLGPAIVAVTALINDNAEEIGAAFSRTFDRWERSWAGTGKPVLDALLASWEGLGTTGRGYVLGFVAAVSVLLTALLPIGATAGAAALGIGGLTMIASAAIPILTSLWGVIVAVEVALAGLSLPIVVALAASLAVLVGALAISFGWLAAGALVLAGGVLAVVAIFRELAAESNVLTNLMPIFRDEAIGGVTERLKQLAAAGRAFVGGFLSGFREVAAVVIESLQPAFDELVYVVLDILHELGLVGTVTSDIAGPAYVLGQIVAGVLAPALVMAGDAVLGLITLGRLVGPMFGSMIRSVRRFTVAIFGLVTGSLSAKDAVTLMLLTISQNLLVTVRAVISAVLGTMSAVMARIAATVANVPGLGHLAAGLAEGAANLEGDATRKLDDTIKRIDQRAQGIESARRAAAGTTVNVPEQPVEVQVKSETKVVIDENELGRASGDAAVRSGERGTGPALPAKQRGRVLRRGLTVTPLRTAEAF